MQNIARLRNFGYIFGVIASVAIFFQLHIQLSETILNINLADPFVALATIVMGLIFLISGKLPQWNFKEFPILILVFTIVLGFALFIGVTKIGITQWAFIARMFGWFVLLGYVFAGSLIIRNNEIENGHAITLVIACSASLIVFWDTTSRLLIINGWDLGFTPADNFRGFSQNRNAFAFQLSVTLALLIGYSKLSVGENAKFIGLKIYALLTALVIIGVVLSGSRSAMAAIGIMVFLCLLLKIGNRKILALAIVYALIIWSSIFFVSQARYFNSDQQNIKYSNILIQSAFSNASSNQERMLALTKGLELWKESPILGTGLGVFIATSPKWFDKRQVIHNTPLWIAVELGIVGFILVAWGVIRLLRFSLSNGFKGANPMQSSLVLLILVTGVIGMFHEIFFQRIFWLALGILLATPFTNFKVTGNET